MNPRTTHPVGLVAATLLRRYRPMALFFCSGAALAVAVLVAVLAVFGDIRVSGWNVFTTSGTKYLLLVTGVPLGSSNLRPFVAHGITRRHYLMGSAVFGAVVAVAFTVFGLVGFAVERQVYDAAGWLPGLDDPYPVNSVADGLAHLARMAPLSLAYLLAGWLLTVGFYRFGVWIGMAMIIPGYVPIVASELLFGTRWTAGHDDPPVPLGVAVGLSLAVSALALLALWALVRTIPIRRSAT